SSLFESMPLAFIPALKYRDECQLFVKWFEVPVPGIEAEWRSLQAQTVLGRKTEETHQTVR
ncbi:hypothetical protein, partial [Siminovitchia fortis]|uniref:hypothetical protein n=1 Tax=Siminovitchia fortis TaxID=254758 RepID=UPI001C9414A8